MKAKLLNGKEVDVLVLNPVEMFMVLSGGMGHMPVHAGEFPAEGAVYLYQEGSETEDQFRQIYEEGVQTCPDREFPPLAEMLENDCAVIGKVAYRLDGKVQQMDKMVFAEPEQFDCLYEVDENGVINIEDC